MSVMINEDGHLQDASDPATKKTEDKSSTLDKVSTLGTALSNAVQRGIGNANEARQRSSYKLAQAARAAE